MADVHPAPGREIVLLAPSLAAGLYWDEGSDEPAAFRMASIRFLWQPARDFWCFDLQRAVVDFDGDGLDDLLVPEPGVIVFICNMKAKMLMLWIFHLGVSR